VLVLSERAEDTSALTSASHANATANSPEAAVRRYLEFVRDPATARDQVSIDRLTRQIEEANDVLERVRLLSELERANQADGAELLQGFVRHARRWAAANRITVGAFRSMGVSAVVLAEAGFDLGHGTIAERSGTPAVRSTLGLPGSPGEARVRLRRPPSKPLAPAVPSATIEQWMLNTNGAFTLLDAMREVGGSPMTVRKVADRLVGRQVLRSLGQVATPGARGRAPERFERIHHDG
jgi:hypothetical protein